ncbi:MAG: SipW-dependent-type signal peptide-containing protein, partial [Oscillospiraceae bacterium]|nr:SipW-dependent-type signal peptide-containing protein [Oscillospiraceae bacterium]
MKKQKRKHSPVLLTMAIVLAVATLISGSTFAWFQSQEKVTNHLETDQFANGDVSLKEIWDAEDGKDWQPGEELNKDVSVVNTGSVEALARVSFEEVLLKLIDDQTQTDKDKTKWGAWSDGQPDRELVDSVYDGDLLKVPHLFNPGAYGGPSSLWYELSPGTSDIQLGTVTFLPSAPDGVFFRYL